ncbi:hypothetical protein, partial [Thermodesulfitimonas autotrophica]|uniref:hypothetical protein n=1 Tax=Thermodesulfitimonas autotrophica TaxID=1894989 RepID=UPI002FE1CBC0
MSYRGTATCKVFSTAKTNIHYSNKLAPAQPLKRFLRRWNLVILLLDPGHHTGADRAAAFA